MPASYDSRNRGDTVEYGFTYNGIHCKDMGCNYIPSATKRLVQPDYSVASSDQNGMDGGYFYGAYLKVRPFVQDCYFEDLTEAQLRKIYMWFDRRSAGELIFDARPHVKYMVRPTKAFEPELYEHVFDGDVSPTYSGTFSMTLSAYDPYGYQTKTFCDIGDDLSDMNKYCGILSVNQMPGSPTPGSTSFLVYNCGTEPCGLNVSLRGSAPNGLTLNNLTNGTSCKLVSLPKGPAIQAVDADNCRVRYGFGDALDNPYASTFKDGFEFHEDGYISLDSYGEVYRDVSISWKAGTNAVIINSGAKADDHLIGKYIWIYVWQKIEDVLDDGSLILAGTFQQDGQMVSTITTMNEIVITGDDVALTDIYVTCSPRVL